MTVPDVATGYWLLDNPNPNAPRRDDGNRGWFYPTRRDAVSGAIAVHSTEGIPDYDAPDYGAENTARYFTHSTRPASYHRIVDSDSIVRCVPLSYTAFHDATGGNSHAMSVSFGTQAHTWRRNPDHDEAMIRNGARALAEEARYWASLAPGRDPKQCARWISPAQYRARQPGLCEHGELDPGRRSDPWTAHPFRSEFRARLVAAMAAELGGDPEPTPEPKEWDEMATKAEILEAVEEGAALAVMAITGDQFAPGDIRTADVYTLRDLSAEVRAGVVAVGVNVITAVARQSGVAVDETAVAQAITDELARRLAD